ncbi:MAG: hypothetical protein JW888_05150 [Pirellulales bacterium]|nr:hypothetical protein [Pirellulales bacterium]
MEQWITRLVAGIILLSAIGMSWWHLRVRRGHRRQDLSPAQYDHYRRQFRRRIQISAMLGILALTLAVESLIDAQPMIEILLGAGMLLLVLWIVLLALVDALASRAHFGRLRSDYIVEQAKLQAEAHRLRGTSSLNGNGRSRGGPLGPGGEDER